MNILEEYGALIRPRGKYYSYQLNGQKSFQRLAAIVSKKSFTMSVVMVLIPEGEF